MDSVFGLQIVEEQVSLILLLIFLFYIFVGEYGDNTKKMHPQIESLITEVLSKHDLSVFDGISFFLFF